VFFLTFILDFYKFGFGYNPHKRFDNFKKHISKDLEEIGGFPSYILIDRNFKLLFCKSGGDFKSIWMEMEKKTNQY